MTLKSEIVGGALVLTIDRPEAKNAINRELATALRDAVVGAASAQQLRAIVLTAGGQDVFVAGGDLKEFQHLELGRTGAQHIVDFGTELGRMEQSPLPVIAAVQGDVLGGGCELLLMCDFAVMEEHSAIQFRHARMGLTPAWGGTSRLIERVGALRAAELLLTARRVSAAEALSMGLVNEVVPTGASRQAALALSDRIAQSSREAVAALKHSLVEARQAHRARAFEREAEVFRQVWGGESHRQAMSAFLHRR